MRTSDFDYPLPRDLIAQRPIEPRDHSRLLVLDRGSGGLLHRRFYELPDLLVPGDLLLFNDSRVIPARLHGQRSGTGGRVELLLLRRHVQRHWWCLARPARRLRPGETLLFPHGLEARILKTGEKGLRLVELNDEALVERVGEVALPPYVHEPLADPERYQTVYARVKGSVAAPTAGLHFTPQLLEQLHKMGVEFAFVTLHVGLDTFRPVEEEDPGEHKLHTEYWEMPQATAEAIDRARAQGRRIVAVGTTTVRVLEQAALLGESQGVPGFTSGHPEHGRPHTARPEPVEGHPTLGPGSGWADLFILPGHRFRLVDAMITNFHLPRSTLLMLVSAFAGHSRILHAYKEAVQQRYRFYSFGDGMLVL